jgi:hypothetical protein
MLLRDALTVARDDPGPPGAPRGLRYGPTDAVNRLYREPKRVDNYLRRRLLHCGVRWQTHRTARLRGRSPRLVA